MPFWVSEIQMSANAMSFQMTAPLGATSRTRKLQQVVKVSSESLSPFRPAMV